MWGVTHGARKSRFSHVFCTMIFSVHHSIADFEGKSNKWLMIQDGRNENDWHHRSKEEEEVKVKKVLRQILNQPMSGLFSFVTDKYCQVLI